MTHRILIASVLGLVAALASVRETVSASDTPPSAAIQFASADGTPWKVSFAEAEPLDPGLTKERIRIDRESEFTKFYGLASGLWRLKFQFEGERSLEMEYRVEAPGPDSGLSRKLFSNGRQVTGRFQTADGAPIPGVPVMLVGRGLMSGANGSQENVEGATCEVHATSGKDGTFLIGDLFLGTYDCYFGPNRLTSPDLVASSLVDFGGKTWALAGLSLGSSLDVSEKVTSLAAPVVLEPATNFVEVIVNVSANPTQGATVSLWRDRFQPPMGGCCSDSPAPLAVEQDCVRPPIRISRLAGEKARFEFPSGRVEILVSMPGYPEMVQTLDLRDHRESPLVVVFDLPAKTELSEVVGRVTDIAEIESRLPAGLQLVLCVDLDGGKYRADARGDIEMDCLTHRTFKCEKDGTFRTGPLLPGAFKATVFPMIVPTGALQLSPELIETKRQVDSEIAFKPWLPLEFSVSPGQTAAGCIFRKSDNR